MEANSIMDDHVLLAGFLQIMRISAYCEIQLLIIELDYLLRYNKTDYGFH